MRWQVLRMACAAAAAVALAGCSAADGTGVADPPEVVTEPETADDPTPGDGSSVDDPADGAVAPALATATVPIDWVDGGELEMAVTGIDVIGELLRVAVTFIASLPPEAEEVALGAVLAGNEDAPGAPVKPELIDPVNLKAYEVVAGGSSLGSSLHLRSGAPRTLAFYYAAPQDAVTTIDIHWSSAIAPLTDVPFPQ